MAQLNNYNNLPIPGGPPMYIFNTSGTKMTDVRIDYQQEFLFDKNDLEEIKKDEYLHDKKEDHKDISVCVSRILNTFRRRLANMHFFLYNSADPYKTVIQHIYALPHMQMNACINERLHDFPHQIQIASNFSGDRHLFEGWDYVPDNELQTHKNKRKINRTELFYNIKNVKRIRMWIWGFEILAHDDISMLGILEFAVVPGLKPQNLCSEQLFNKQVLENSEYMSPSMIWLHGNEAK